MPADILAIDSRTIRDFWRSWREHAFRAQECRHMGSPTLAAGHEERAEIARADMFYHARKRARLKFNRSEPPVNVVSFSISYDDRSPAA